jgi:hypothetical protein
MLALLNRRDIRRVDGYWQRGVRLDPVDDQIGAGTGVWTEADVADASLEIRDDGVQAAALFTDADGRRVEVRVDNRDGRTRRRGELLAPVSAAIEKPTSLLLVRLPEFDLVRTGGREPVLRIDHVELTIGHFPAPEMAPTALHQVRRTARDDRVLPDSKEALESYDTANPSYWGSARDGVLDAA